MENQKPRKPAKFDHSHQTCLGVNVGKPATVPPCRQAHGERCNASEARCLTSTMVMAAQKPHRYENCIGHAARTRSTAAAIRNTLRSWPLRATSISPTGSAPARGRGSDIAQRSKQLTIAGLRSTIPLLAVKPALLATSVIIGATIGVVGTTSAS